MIWREKRNLLIVLGLLLAANTIFFFTYRVQYESRLEAFEEGRDTANAQLAEAKRTRVAAEQQVAAYRKIERDVTDIIQNRWATQDERLTRLITEVKGLAVRATLAPVSYSFSRGEAKSAPGSASTSGGRGNQKIGATEMSIKFNVQGTYEQIRRLINMIETSPQFVIIESLGLGGAEAENLTLDIHVKTLFHDPSAEAPTRRTGNQDL